MSIEIVIVIEEIFRPFDWDISGFPHSPSLWAKPKLKAPYHKEKRVIVKHVRDIIFPNFSIKPCPTNLFTEKERSASLVAEAVGKPNVLLPTPKHRHV